jgi:transcriptional regulator with PAS, ATPase and Fis domain
MHTRMQSELVSVLDHTPDTPIISATKENLHDAVLAGRFREDLYYRLNTIHIVWPNASR